MADPTEAAAAKVAPSASPPQPQRRRIVVFADGTGNAFSTQESNVWRLFQALDQGQPDQIARYIRGVGTSGFRPLAMLDSATGFGVPSNVRKLYRFICWNWRPDDEIWLFGFSRGAFTVRTLVGLIHHEGLMPAGVSRAEMSRNAMSAWRAYRAKTAPRTGTLPTIWVTRWIRDRLLGLVGKWRGHRSYEDLAAQAKREGRDGRTVGMRFLGVFDTVEAFGVPFEELRSAIDKAVWPISFRNMRLAGNVELARHALALDEERTSFRPVRFDPPTGQRQDIKEVWFAGVHSDVGGGYPDGALSLVAMLWMADEAEQAGLRFKAGVLDGYRARATPFGPMHDSRSGLAAIYRYDPRHISPGSKPGTAPVVHHSVAEKMALGSENYAPVTLPPTALILMPDRRQVAALGPPDPELHGDVRQLTPDLAQSMLPQFATLAPTLPRPDKHYIALTWDTVWWRRVAYFAMAASIIAVVALPWTADLLTTLARSLLVGAASLIDRPAWGVAAWAWLTGTNSGIGNSLAAVSSSLGGIVPSYLSAWVSVFVEHFIGSAAILAIAYGFYTWNGRLRDLIADRAHRSWSPQPAAPAPSVWGRLARRARRSRRLRLAHRIVPELVSYAALLLLFTAAAVLTSRAVIDYRSGRGSICAGSEALKPLPVDGMRAQAMFEPKDLCWHSGVSLDKGRSYTVWIRSTEPFENGGTRAGIAGFRSSAAPLRFGVPIRRRWDADWFRLLARIGEVGGTEWVLAAVDGTGPIDLDDDFDAEIKALCAAGRGPDVTLPSSDDACAHMSVQTRRALRAEVVTGRLSTTFVSTFTAPQSGEFFLYVNDAVFAVPFLPPLTSFYDDNRGKAEVFIRETPAPPFPILQP